MTKLDYLKTLIGLPSTYQVDMASYCVLFGMPKEELLQEYTPLTPEQHDEREIEHLKNYRDMIRAAAGRVQKKVT